MRGRGHSTAIDDFEWTGREVAKWAAEYVTGVVTALAPDGRAFGQVKLNEDEEMQLYVRNLRGNPDAWRDWIDERVQKVKEMLQTSGLSPEDTAKAHPYDIVQAFALNYSKRMERLLNEEAFNARARATPPSSDGLPDYEEDVEIGNGR